MDKPWNYGGHSTFRPGESIEARCRRLRPACICYGCEHNKYIPECGVRCCAVAKAGQCRGMKRPDCSVLVCPGFVPAKEK